MDIEKQGRKKLQSSYYKHYINPEKDSHILISEDWKVVQYANCEVWWLKNMKPHFFRKCLRQRGFREIYQKEEVMFLLLGGDDVFRR